MIRHPHLLAATIARPELRRTSGGGLKRPLQGSFSLGRPGRPALEPTLLIVIPDDSGSVVGPAGADPVSNRYEEAWCAFQTIGRHGGKHELGAVLHFDAPTSGDVPPTPLAKAGLQRLRSGLHVPRDAAGTSCLRPSLSAAIALADRYPNHHATLVILSDFELFDPNVDQVLDNLAAFPGDVHAIVLGGMPIDGLLDGRIRITPVSYDDLPGTVARAVFASLIMHRPGSREAVR